MENFNFCQPNYGVVIIPLFLVKEKGKGVKFSFGPFFYSWYFSFTLSDFKLNFGI